MAQPLMPHATAAWLVENSSLTFEQIAEFCGLHILEVQAIADDTAATKLTGRDPIRAGELTHEEIEKGQKDPDYTLQMWKAPEAVRRTKGPRYTPVSKRQDKPDGIAWIVERVVPISLPIWPSLNSGWLRISQATPSGLSWRFETGV